MARARELVLERAKGGRLFDGAPRAGHRVERDAVAAEARAVRAAGEHAEPSVLLHRLFYALGEVVAEARQRHSRARACKVYQRLVDAACAENYAQHHEADEDARGRQLRFVEQQLAHRADRAAHEKCF